MKHINFITTLSPQKQYAIRRWFWVTFFLCICSIVLSAYVIVPQLVTYISLKNDVKILREQTKQHAEHSTKRDALKTEHEKIRMQSFKMVRYTDTPKNPHAYIAAVVQACGDGVQLEAMNVHKKNCEITILCPTAEYATVFVKRLSALEQFSGVKLVSLQHDNQTKLLRCIVKSKIIFDR